MNNTKSGRRKIRRGKVRALALGVGYVETASWSQWVVVHETGFNTLEKALSSLKDAVNAYRKEEQVEHLSVGDIVYEVILGTLQDHGYLWEHLAEAGWNATPAWGTLRHLDKAVLVEQADQYISDPVGAIISNKIAVRSEGLKARVVTNVNNE